MGIFLRADKLSLAIEKSKEIPTRLLRTLMDMFFTPEVMAGSTAKGSSKRGLDALDPQTMEALYREYCYYYFLFIFIPANSHAFACEVKTSISCQLTLTHQFLTPSQCTGIGICSQHLRNRNILDVFGKLRTFSYWLRKSCHSQDKNLTPLTQKKLACRYTL